MTMLTLPRRRLLGGLAALGTCLALPLLPARAAGRLEVHKARGCGCCDMWADHLRAHGFACDVTEHVDLEPIKARLGVPDALRSCHTALLEGYVVEGHVPAMALERLLRERPAIAGLAVPGMPAGSPGMPSDRPEAFTVVAFAADGRQESFMRFVGESAA
jgi:hypothetical protein